MTAADGGEQRERERERLAALKRYEVLDTEPERVFDDLVAAAASIANTPFASVSLVDEHRQWFKAFAGFETNQTRRDVAFCDLVVQDADEVIIPDTRLEPRLAGNPDVVGGPQYRFYAGFPLRTPEGAILGTLCVVDKEPGVLTDQQLQILRTLASQVMAQLQLRLELRQRDELVAQQRRTSEQLEQAQQLAQVGSWSVDLATDEVHWSRQTHTIMGTDPELPLTTTTFLDYIHPDDHDLVQSTVDATFRTGRSDDIEFKVVRPDGQIRVARGRYQVDKDPGGRPVRLSGTIVDVTDQRVTEQELVHARDLLHQVMSTSTTTSVVATDSDGLITVFNRGAELMLGYSADEMLGTRGYLRFHDMDEVQARMKQYGLENELAEVFVRATALGEDEWTYIHRDGSRRIAQLSASHMSGPDGERAGLVGFMVDVTQARAAQQELLEEKDRFEQLLNSVTEQAIVGTDRDGVITIFNRGAERMLGYSAQDMVGTPISEQFLVGDLNAKSGQRARIETNGGDRYDTRWRRADGAELIVQVSITGIRNHDGELVGYVAIGADVTEQRQSEAQVAAANEEAAERRAQLEEAERLAAVGSWSLDLRTGQVYWSPEMLRISGLDPATEITASTFRGIIHPDDRDRVDELIREDREGGHYSFEHRILHPDGTELVVLANGRGELDDQGNVIKIHGAVQDLTQARRLEAEVLRANDLFSQLLSSATAQAIIGIDHEGNVNIFNRGAEQMLGYTAQDVLGTSGWHAFHDEQELPAIVGLYQTFQQEADEQAVQAAVSRAQAPDWTFVRRDGSRISVQIRFSPMRDTSGTVVGAVAIATDVTRQRQAERELAQASDELASRSRELEEAQHIAGVGSWSFDLVTHDLKWSAQMYRILGLDPGSTAASLELFRTLTHPQDREHFDQLSTSSPAVGDGDLDYESRLLLPDGSVRFVLTRARYEYGTDGKALRANGTVQDITEIRRAQRELIEAHDLLNQVIDASTEQAIYVVDAGAGPIRLFNSGAERLLGYSAHEAIGSQLYFQFFDAADVHEKCQRYGIPLDRELSNDVFLAATAAGDREWTMIGKDGRRRAVLLTMNQMRDPDGVLTGSLVIATDVTAARQAERDLIAARDQFVQLLGTATDQAILGTGIDGKINLFNKGAETMLGYTAEEAIGHRPWDLLLDPDTLAARSGPTLNDQARRQLLDNAVEGAAPQDREWVWLRKDGIPITVWISLTPMLDENGELSGYLSIATDVTERLAAERERDRAERETQAALLAVSQARDEALAANQAKSAFLATMSHEIRTPMNAVIGMTGLLLDTELDDEQRDLLETVRGSGDQLLAIINDILDFSKIEAGELDLEYRGFDLSDLVEGTVAQFAGAAKGLDLISHIDDGCPVNVTGDVTRLRQVLSNLVGNAIKFTSDGHVLVQVRVADEPSEETDGNWRLRFEVKDTGIGIPEESMHRLFKSFSQVDASTTRNYGGTGLGLAISKALVQAMGGDIWVESQLGAGSSFIFTVLLAPDDSEIRARPGRMSAASVRDVLRGRRALIVDDNATNRRILTLQLGAQGMHTEGAVSPVDALHLLSQPGQQFDLAILDFNLPVLDGAQLAAAIRQLPQWTALPLLLLSSIGRRPAAGEDLFATVMTKPVRSGSLLENIAKIFAVQPDPVDEELATDSIPAPRQEAMLALAPEATELAILLAEDNEVNQKVGKLMLAKLGHQADIVGNGQAAVEAARARDYDVILMDMHMPVMDGLEATRRIRAEFAPDRQPVIVALTASVTLEDREACAAAGMNSYLSKPVRPDDLAGVLALLRERSPQQPQR